MKLEKILKEVEDKGIREGLRRVEEWKERAKKWIDKKVPENIVSSITTFQDVSDDLLDKIEMPEEKELWNKVYGFIEEKKKEIATKFEEVLS